MFSRLTWFANLLRWPFRLLVKSKVVQEPSVKTLAEAPQPVFYITRLAASSDLAALRHVCIQQGLPDPTGWVQIGHERLPRTLFLDNPQPMWGQRQATEALKQGQLLLKAHTEQPELALHLIPVSICWGRAPGKEASVKSILGELKAPNWLKKCFIVLISGRHTLVQFSRPVSIRTISEQLDSSEATAHKLLRVARVHFHRQQLAATGPRQPDRDALFNGLLASEAVRRAIDEEAASKDISVAEARQQALELLHEIAADYQESAVRVGDRFLSWLWQKLYTGIEVKNAQVLRDLAQKGHEIVYLPCHRSHMDYLLLSYIIYQQGLAAPHIAAGINLNFWPIGGFFRRGGAFFIRRSFSGNKLYSAVFREYLSQLFRKGYAVKYYSEGGRSRTGRLLPPKTGMLAMTLQAMLRGIDRPVTIVPVYLGYEHVMEVSTYLRELKGSAKKKESALGILKAIRKLRNYGFGYVNFGEPLSINHYLQQQQPQWRQAIDPVEPQRPTWLTPVVADIAQQVMVRINQSAAINSVNLIAMCLLATPQHTMAKPALLAQLRFYLALHQAAPYHQGVSTPGLDVEQLLSHALSLQKVQMRRDEFGELVSLSDENAVLFSYYRNNISHLFIIPALLATMLRQQGALNSQQLQQQLGLLLPLLAQELFVAVTDLAGYVDAILQHFVSQGALTLTAEQYQVVDSHAAGYAPFKLLSLTASDTLQRYAMLFNLLASQKPAPKAELEQQCHLLAQRLLQLHGIDSPEYHDKHLFGTLLNATKDAGYVSIDGDECLHLTNHGQACCQLINQWLEGDILQSILQISRDADTLKSSTT